jgi:hypothetical protein
MFSSVATPTLANRCTRMAIRFAVTITDASE